MLLLLGGALGLLGGLALGGSLAPLGRVRLRWSLVVPIALVIKELGIWGPMASVGAGPWLYVVSALALFAWLLYHRRELPWDWIIAAGMALNLVVVLANAGHMPVRVALAHRGPPQLLELGSWGQYVLEGPQTRLSWLDDTIGLPGLLGRAFPQAYSAGDLIAALGLLVTLLLITRPSRLRRITRR